MKDDDTGPPPRVAGGDRDRGPVSDASCEQAGMPMDHESAVAIIPHRRPG